MARTRSDGSKRKGPAADPPVEARRVDRHAEIVDQCTGAKQVADAIGEKFLGYLLAMVIQETRAAMRVEIKTRPKLAEPSGKK